MGSRDDDSSTELLEDGKDDVGLYRCEARQQDGPVYTQGRCDEDGKEHADSDADVVVSVGTGA
ncbi:unnamed protein product [Fusarium graminearum]|nr:unnamed protein product [Fusarium graminearum]CAG1997317.1 unnamed protein product [Fusarium graminearum]VTO83198.1 unnamed protein product [Fusarium graminearum]